MPPDITSPVRPAPLPKKYGAVILPAADTAPVVNNVPPKKLFAVIVSAVTFPDALILLVNMFPRMLMLPAMFAPVALITPP